MMICNRRDFLKMMGLAGAGTLAVINSPGVLFSKPAMYAPEIVASETAPTYCGETIYFKRLLTDQEAAVIGKYLADKYDVKNPFNPAGVGNLTAHFDASKPETMVIDPAGKVVVWQDLSGNENHLLGG